MLGQRNVDSEPAGYINARSLVGERVPNEAEGESRPAELLGDFDTLLSRGAARQC